MRRTLLALGGTVLALASIRPASAARAADNPVVAAPADDNTGAYYGVNMTLLTQ